MRMEEGLDSGPILLQAATAIGPDETAGELSSRLAALGAHLMVEALDGLERGDLAESPQDAARATLAPRLRRERARAAWSLGAAELANQLRAHTPWPGMTAELRGAPVKLLRALPLPAPPALPATGPSEPGTYLGLEPQGIAVACGAGTALAVAELQRPGRKAQRAADFVNGERLRPGERFS
jgi:methionyl-tRNA formyltransferase